MIEVDGDVPAPGSGGFEDFYGAHFVRASRLAYLLTGSESLAPEIAQDALLAVMDRWKSIDAPAAYLRTAVLNRSRSAQRRATLERRHQFRLATAELADGSPAIDETWHRLRTLSADQRAVVVLRYYEDLTLAEIADVLSKPLGTVKSLLHRALSHLKETIRD